MPESITLPAWVTTEPVYVTLIGLDDEANHNTILIERVHLLVSRATSNYQAVAFVVDFWGEDIAINGRLEDLEEPVDRRLRAISEEALHCVTPGSMYYSDPDAS